MRITKNCSIITDNHSLSLRISKDQQRIRKNQCNVYLHMKLRMSLYSHAHMSQCYFIYACTIEEENIKWCQKNNQLLVRQVHNFASKNCKSFSMMARQWLGKWLSKWLGSGWARDKFASKTTSHFSTLLPSIWPVPGQWLDSM